MKATLNSITYDIMTGYVIKLTTQQIDSSLEELQDKEVNVDIKKFYKKRSLQSNAYAWELLGKIAKKLHDTTTNVYRKYIRELGICEFVCIQDNAKESFKKAWLDGHTGRYIEEEPSKINGCTNLKVFYSSSDFDSEQMSRFIDSIKIDCEQLGIKEI